MKFEIVISKPLLFVKRQILQIKQGGLKVFVKKLTVFLEKAYSLFLMVLAIPAVVFVRVIKPIVVIRFGVIDIGRIGGIYYADWYLSECRAGLHDNGNFDIFYGTKNNGKISNKQWLKMWKRVLHIFPFWKYAHAVDRLNKLIPNYEPHIIQVPNVILSVNRGENRRKETLRCVLNSTNPFIAFNNEEEIFGQIKLKKLGIEEGTPFVCFHSRDSAYLDSISPEEDWHYHDFRDSNIENYIPAMKILMNRGYYAVRMGAVVKEKLDIKHPRIIDYAANGTRTEFMDIYLGAKCSFFICSETGISAIPEMFRKPVAYVNWPPEHFWHINTYNVATTLFIFKNAYSRKENRFLKFKEISELSVISDGNEYNFADLEIETIENTPDEISAVAIEMEERLKGKYIIKDEDEYLQARFWRLFERNRLKGPNLRIGAEFLRKNCDLLD